MTLSPSKMRQRRSRVHPALCALAVFAALGSPAVAFEEPYPAQITPPAGIADLPSTLVVDDGPFTAPPDANLALNSHNSHELRLRHRHLHRRQKDEEDEEDDKDTDEDRKIVKNKDIDEITRTQGEEKDEKSTKTAASNDDDDEKETKTAGPTQTLTEDPDSLSTRSLSVAPSSTRPTETADPDAPLPVPFDGTFASEFKTEGGDDSCPNFISSLLNSDALNDCYPISMLILVRVLRLDRL